MASTKTVPITALRDHLSGEVIGPSDPGYDDARQLFAGNFEGKAMSVPLASLFLLNGTEDEMTTRAPNRCRNCTPPAVSHPPEAPIQQSAR